MWIFYEKVNFCVACKIEVDYNIVWVWDLRYLAKDHGLRDYSKLRKADLISLLRSHDASTRKSIEEGNQKQFDPEESGNEDEVYFSLDDPTIIRKKEHGNNSIQKNRITKNREEVMISSH